MSRARTTPDSTTVTLTEARWCMACHRKVDAGAQGVVAGRFRDAFYCTHSCRAAFLSRAA